METKHTPGPWKARYLPQHRIRVTTDLGSPSLGDDSICDIALWMVDYAEQHANASLIAAVPDMLPIVELVASLPIADDVADDVPVFGLDGAYVTHGDVRAARAAIAKAKGEQP